MGTILEEGFVIPNSPRSGNFFGKGIYFTSEPAKADSYAPKNNGEWSLVVAKVLLGRAHVEKEKPRIHGVDEDYDSLISYKAPDGILRHSEYVVYDAAQTLPLYVVRYVHGDACSCSKCSISLKSTPR